MRTESFFGWIFHSAVEGLADKSSQLLRRLGEGSLLQKVKLWAGKPMVQTSAWILLILGFIAYFLTMISPVIPFRYVALAYEMLVYICFFTIAIHKKEWGLFLFAFYLPFLTYRPLLVLIFMLLIMLLVEGIPKERIKAAFTNKLNVSIGLFMLFMLLTAIASAGWQESLKNYGLYFLTSLLLYFIILFYVHDRRTLIRFAVSLVAGALMISVFAAFQYVTVDYTNSKWVDALTNPLLTKRVDGTFQNPNLFAQYLVLIAPIAFVLMWFGSTWRKKIYLAISFLVILLAIVLTFSRGGWLAIFIAGILLAAMIHRRLILLAIIAGAVGVNFLPEVIMDRILSIFNEKDTSSAYRFKAWSSALSMIRDYWATGIGMDERTFLRVYPEYMLADVRVFHFHNIYLQHFVMGGIMGIFSVLFLFYQSFRSLVELIFTFKGRDQVLNGIAKALFASLLAIAISGLTDDIWRHYAVNFTFWSVFAMVAVLYQLSKQGVYDDGK